MSTRIYLDYNATAPIRIEALQAMNEALQGVYNGSSVHSFGRDGRKVIEHAREDVATLAGSPANQVIFNSGATEGNNTVLNHFRAEHILVGATEHPSVLEAVKELASSYGIIPVTPHGTIDMAALETLLKETPTALVSVMLVNNETGVIQPAKEIAILAHRYGALYHADGVQAAGRIPIDMNETGIDFLTLSAHKIGGPQGVGALVLGLCGTTPTLLHGGGQEKRARAGTENVAGIAGFGAAAQAALKHVEDYSTLKTLRDDFETKIASISPEIIFYGQQTPRVANTSLFSLPGTSSETVLMALDLDGIAVSNGSACSSGRIEPSHVLKAMGASDAEAKAALRVSMGWGTRAEDINRFLNSWEIIYNRMKEKIQTHA